MISPPRFLIVDGHSIIHAWDDLRKLHQRASSRYLAREELLKRMRLLQDMTAQRVVVVFDGTGSKLTEEREDGGIQVFYADAGQTADSVIERLAARTAKQCELRVCTADHPDAETARSRYRVRTAREAVALLELSPETGRMHQLRVHLAAIGHPIAGDARYGGALVVEGRAVPRLMLHASALIFPHPAGGEMRLQAAPPEDLQGLISGLELA